MKLFVSYIYKRLKPLQFLVLACLLSLLIHSPDADIFNWIGSVAFLLGSFFVFRFLDDAGAKVVDKKNHPARTYLNDDHFNKFLIINALVVLLYVVMLFLLKWNNLTYILLLLLVSVVLYGIFSKSETAILLIPLLKYPVLLSTLVYYPGNYWSEIIASFFIVLAYDLAEDVHHKKSTFWWLMLVELICGVLLFQKLNLSLFLLFLLAPIFQTLLARFLASDRANWQGKGVQYSGYRYLHIQLIIYYPLTYFIFTYFAAL